MVQREPYCPQVEPGEIDLLAHSPVSSSSKRRPCGALLQPVVGMWLWMCRVGRSRRSFLVRESGDADETLPFQNRLSNLKENTDRWVVWVGRHAPEKISGAPKGHLSPVRNRAQNARVKGGLTLIHKARIGGAKAGPSEPMMVIYEPH